MYNDLNPTLVTKYCDGLATTSDKLTVSQNSGKCTPMPKFLCKLFSGKIAI